MTTSGREVVVDASVALKWFFTEAGSEAALCLLHGTNSLHVPDLIYAEVGNTLWKRAHRGEVTPEEAGEVLEALSSIPWTVHGLLGLLRPALEVASRAGCTVYDALYVALAAERCCSLMTADAKLASRLRGTPLGAVLVLLDDTPQSAYL